MFQMPKSKIIRYLFQYHIRVTWFVSPEVPEGDVPVPACEDEDAAGGGLDTARVLAAAAGPDRAAGENISSVY